MPPSIATQRSIDDSLQFMLTDRMTWCSSNDSLDPGQRRSVKRTGQNRCSGVLFEYFASSAGSEHHGIDGSGAHLRPSMRPTRTSVHSAPSCRARQRRKGSDCIEAAWREDTK